MATDSHHALKWLANSIKLRSHMGRVNGPRMSVRPYWSPVRNIRSYLKVCDGAVHGHSCGHEPASSVPRTQPAGNWMLPCACAREDTVPAQWGSLARASLDHGPPNQRTSVSSSSGSAYIYTMSAKKVAFCSALSRNCSSMMKPTDRNSEMSCPYISWNGSVYYSVHRSPQRNVTCKKSKQKHISNNYK